MKLIDGVKIIENKRLYDERGWLQEIGRQSQLNKTIKQVYITNAEKNVIKAFHYHLFQSDYMTCIKGKMKLVLVDTRYDSPTLGLINTFILENMNQSVIIPEKVMHGFQGLREGENLILNIVNQEYNHTSPDEYRFDCLQDFYILNNGSISQSDIHNDYNDINYLKTIKIPQDLWEIKNG